MNCLAETLIYLLAILGIIFTSMTFFEMFTGNNTMNKSYRIFSKKKKRKEKVEVVIKLNGIKEEREKELTRLIQEEENVNIKEIADIITIEKVDNVDNN
ncbi:MAG: hypothetical protein PHP54_06090 [Clostridia bacterium]|nr:hypothetical protein [Clostridia bacterium]